MTEILGRLDVLVGGRLRYVEKVDAHTSGDCTVDSIELSGSSPRRQSSFDGAVRQTAGCATCRSVVSRLSADEFAERLGFVAARSGRSPSRPYCGTTPNRTSFSFSVPGATSRRRSNCAIRPAAPIAPANWPGRSRLCSVDCWASRSVTKHCDNWPSRASRPRRRPRAAASHAATRVIGDFELLSRIGAGGMGVVYRAWQRSLDRQVALKCVTRTGDRQTETRFAREIRTLGRIEHPNLVKIYTSGSDDDRLFYAMELIEGATLASRLSEVADQHEFDGRNQPEDLAIEPEHGLPRDTHGRAARQRNDSGGGASARSTG